MLLNSTYKILTNVFTGKPVIFAFPVIIIVLLLVGPAKASTIEQLVDQKKIELSIRLQNEAIPIVGQQLIFEIELATKYSLEKPIKYKLPKVKNTASSPRKSPGYSSSKVVNGETWKSQVRELALFTIAEGIYSIPPIEVFVAIQTPDQGVVEGIIMTATHTFEVIRPTELNDIKAFIVSPDVQFEIDDNQVDTSTFAIGDAVSITIVISATDVPGMLLPATLEQDIEGVSIYRKPPELLDKTNRGLLTGRRSDKVTYIFEQAGQYHIPQQIIYWWNPELEELNELIIPARTWLVDGSAISSDSVVGDNKQLEVSSKVFTLLLWVLIGIVLFLLLFKYRQWFISSYLKITKRQQRVLRKEFITAINTECYLVACQKLYQLVNCYSDRSICLKGYYQADPKKLLALNNLLAAAYKDKNNQAFCVNQMRLLMSPVLGEAINSNRYNIDFRFYFKH